MTSLRNQLQDETGAAGKAFLLFLGVATILAIAGFFLWKPILLPLVGEAVPERSSDKTVYDIPHENPEITVAVPKDWIFQRGLFGKERALVQTPDLKMQIEFETWKKGSAPSLAGALKEIAAANPGSDTPRQELLSKEIVFNYITLEDENIIIGVIGPVSDSDVSAKANALITVQTVDAELEAYLPTLANFLAQTVLK